MATSQFSTAAESVVSAVCICNVFLLFTHIFNNSGILNFRDVWNNISTHYFVLVRTFVLCIVTHNCVFAVSSVI